VENTAASNLRCGERRTKAKNEGGKEAPNLHHESKPNNETPPELLSFPSHYELWPVAYCGEAVWSLVGIRSWSEGYDVPHARYLSEALFSDALRNILKAEVSWRAYCPIFEIERAKGL
jgi:hypothetical protein